MRPSSVFLAASVSLGSVTLAAVPAPGQEPTASVSLDQSLALFNRNSPELHLARSRLRHDLGSGLQGRALPNPTVSFTNEDLGGYSERYLNLTQRVDFLWNAGGRNRRALGLDAQARARFQADSARLVLEVRRTYLEAWTAAEAVTALRRVDGIVIQLLDAAAERFSEGDLAGYDLRRLRVERASLGRRLARAEVALAHAEERLGAMVLADGSIGRVRPQPLPGDAPALPPSFDAVATAVGRRAEVRAARAAVDTREAEAGLARRSVLEGASVTGGLKQQSDGREGLFLGVQLPVPLLDRRGGAADAARAAADGAGAEVAWVQRAVAREASLALARLLSAHRQRALVGDGGFEEAAELLHIARIAYDEGEVGIVELVDAADTFLEAQLMRSAVRVEGWLAFFELDQAVGGLADTLDTLDTLDTGDER